MVGVPGLFQGGHQRGLEIWAISGWGSVRSRDVSLLSSEVGAAKIGNDHGTSDDDCYGG